MTPRTIVLVLPICAVASLLAFALFSSAGRAHPDAACRK
jgi:hypothetical protein